MTHRLATLVALLVVLLPLADAHAQPVPASWSTPLADPLRVASLPLDPAQATAIPPGRWQVSLASAYFNLWSGSWHTATIHKEFGLVGQPITDEELRTLEARHPHDEIWRLDVEGVLTEVTFARGLAGGLSFTLEVPWLEVGRPHWDAISQDVHRALGWNEASRDLFPRGQTLFYVWDPREGRAIERRQDLTGSGIGDVALALSGPAGEAFGLEHRWVVAVEAPTGARDTLEGSGGWDYGARWFATREGRRTRLRLGAGYTWLARSGSFLGVRRSNTWHLYADWQRRTGRLWSLLLSTRLDSSPLADFTKGDPGKASFIVVGGLRRSLGRGGWLAFALGENLPPYGASPDFTLHLQVGACL
jgi:Protein of unknown function (DUF3187)